MIQLVVCLNNEGYPASLEVGKLYRSILDKKAEAEGLLTCDRRKRRGLRFRGDQVS